MVTVVEGLGAAAVCVVAVECLTMDGNSLLASGVA